MATWVNWLWVWVMAAIAAFALLLALTNTAKPLLLDALRLLVSWLFGCWVLGDSTLVPVPARFAFDPRVFSFLFLLQAKQSSRRLFCIISVAHDLTIG